MDLPIKIQKETDELIEQAYRFGLKGRYDIAIELQEQAFNLIPEPREDYHESFNILKYIIEDNLIALKFKEAIRLVEKIHRFYEGRGDWGELERLKGKVYFETGQYEKAYQFFKIAVKKGTLRQIEQEGGEPDNRYLDFYKNPKPLINGEVEPPASLTAIPPSDDYFDEDEGKELPEELGEKIEKLAKQGNSAQVLEKFDIAIEKYEEALTLVPNPKTDWEASTWLYVGIADNQMNIEKFKEAKENYYNALNCPNALENGYIYLGLGQSFFELEDIEKAKEYILKAYMLEGEELFEDEEPKYFELIKPIINGEQLEE